MIYEFDNFYPNPIEIIKGLKNEEYNGQEHDGVLYKSFSEEKDSDFVTNRLQELLPDKIIKNAYKLHCEDDQPCFYGTCPVIALMITSHIHSEDKDLFMLYGDYKLLEELSRR